MPNYQLDGKDFEQIDKFKMINLIIFQVVGLSMSGIFMMIANMD